MLPPFDGMAASGSATVADTQAEGTNCYDERCDSSPTEVDEVSKDRGTRTGREGCGNERANRIIMIYS